MLAKVFDQAGLILDQEKQNKFSAYREMILEYNKIMDITNIVEEKDMYIKHFVDSLYLNKSGLVKDGLSFIDIGTGGGFPGIPLKIYYPDLQISLLDSLNKRVGFLSAVIDKLELTDSLAIHGRAEELARDPNYREQFDIASSRALAPLATLIEYCMAYVKVGGYFIAMKGPNYQDELAASINAIDTMGGKFINALDYSLPDGFGERSLLIFKKVRKTPKKYPRGQGKPRKQPL